MKKGDRIFYRMDLLEGGCTMSKFRAVEYTRLPDGVEMTKEGKIAVPCNCYATMCDWEDRSREE